MKVNTSNCRAKLAINGCDGANYGDEKTTGTAFGDGPCGFSWWCNSML